MRELVLGCGNYPFKKIYDGTSKAYVNPTKVDIDPDCNPDIVLDLNTNSLPFPDSSFDEVHMYEVLEHLGTQGDYKHFFDKYKCSAGPELYTYQITDKDSVIVLVVYT